MIYCSLGEMCHSATLLKSNGLKDASYPFDWIFSSVSMIKHCIEDDFRIYLSKEYYSKTIYENTCQHDFYYNLLYEQVGQPVFNHHNPLEKEEDYAYIQRCVNRFRELLASPEEKTFLLFFKSKYGDYTDWLKEATTLCNFLGRYTTNFNVLCIYHNPIGKQRHNIFKSKNLKFVQLQTISNTNGTFFEEHSDNEYLNRILHEIR